MPTVTRKIQLFFDIGDNPKELKALFKKWYEWQRIVRKAANQISTHLYIQDNIKDFFYITEDVKIKLKKSADDVAGILNTSKDNTTYQVLSKLFKGDCPMGMLSGLSSVIGNTYKKEKKEMFLGNKSLRSYKKDIPLPMRVRDSSNWTKHEDGNYSFSVYGTPFKTWFGHEKKKVTNDTHTKEYMLDMAMKGEVKFCDSSIQIKDNKFFLLAVFSWEKDVIKVDTENVADCYLSIKYPIIIKEGKDRMYTIGSEEEYLHGRNSIKAALQRVQTGAKYNQGGDGRELKLQSIERFKAAEKNFIENRMHVYARELIKYCLKHGKGKIVLNNYNEAKEQTHEGTEEANLLLASWSYYNLSDKIANKAAYHSIVVEKN